MMVKITLIIWIIHMIQLARQSYARSHITNAPLSPSKIAPTILWPLVVVKKVLNSSV